jgi:hypothetical protein
MMNHHDVVSLLTRSYDFCRRPFKFVSYEANFKLKKLEAAADTAAAEAASPLIFLLLVRQRRSLRRRLPGGRVL